MHDGVLRELFSDIFDLSTHQSFFQKDLGKVKKFFSLFRIKDSREWATILRLFPHFSYVKNMFSEYAWGSPSFAKRMGCEHPEELIGKSDLSLSWDVEMATRFQEADERIFLGASATSTKEMWMFKTQENRIVQMHRYPLFNAQGEILGVFGVGKEEILAHHTVHSNSCIKFSESLSQSKCSFFA